MARRPQTARLRSSLPARYRKGFAWNLDMRVPIAMQVSNEVIEWSQHLGGDDQVGKDDQLRIERATFLTLKLREHETAVLRGETGTLTEEQYAQWVNSLHGLVNRLGPRRSRNAHDLRTYLAVRSEKAPSTAPARTTTVVDADPAPTDCARQEAREEPAA